MILRSAQICMIATVLSATVGPVTRLVAQTPSPRWEELRVDLQRIGSVRSLNTHEVEGYPWSVGGETMDRDYTVYDNWKDYVAPLGITQVRLQSGWAKTERTPGEYDFAWLDTIVSDLRAKHVKPWLSLSYGNEIYAGGGGTLLGANLPSSGEALEGWKRYVRTVVSRYSSSVDTWEVWNEPNNKWHPGEGRGNTPGAYAEFLITTSEIIRDVQPQATIIGMATAGVAADWSGAALRTLRSKDALGSLDLLCYHPYARNPDDVDAQVAALRDTLRAYSDRIGLYQGENGAPSEFRKTKALRGYEWTELSQAKWFLRRALNDRAQGIGTNIFSISDLHYPDEINRKGLLLTDDDQRVVRPKHAYYAVSHLVSVFTADVEVAPDFSYTSDTYHDLKAYGFRKGESPMVALWFSGATPSDNNRPTPTSMSFADTRFKDPVYVDLRTGGVYDLPSPRASAGEQRYDFVDLPLYDSPILIAERAAINLE